MSGFILKLIRESVPLTQAGLAERLRVDIATVQGWESGRRPLTSVRTVDLLRLRANLRQAGSDHTAIDALGLALEADLVIADAVDAGGRAGVAEAHPLATSVHQRDLTNLITWPFTGVAPPQLRHLADSAPRRGPAPSHPWLSADDWARFFDHMLVTADASAREDAALLRRQAIYLLGFDNRAGSVDWLRTEQRRAIRGTTDPDHVPSWVEVRSSAMALSAGGDREPLRSFVQTGLRRDRQQTANLNYWAYWTGEIGTVQADDGFMTSTDPRSWHGARPLAELLDRFRPSSGQVELNVHTAWTLLLAQPLLLAGQPQLREAALVAISRLDEDDDLSPRTRRELSDIAYAVRLAQR